MLGSFAQIQCFKCSVSNLVTGPIFFFPFVTKDPNLRPKQREKFVSHTEQPLSVPVVCNKACVYSRYAETSIHSKRWLRGTRYALSSIEFN